MKEKNQHQRKNSSYPEMRVKRVWVNEFQLYIIIHVCVPHFYDLSTLVGCWSSVFIRRIIYIFFFNLCPFDYTAFVFNGKVVYP